MRSVDALRFGLLMNCRGATELVVLTIGYEAGLVNHLAFTVLVPVALITTGCTGPAGAVVAAARLGPRCRGSGADPSRW